MCQAHTCADSFGTWHSDMSQQATTTHWASVAWLVRCACQQKAEMALRLLAGRRENDDDHTEMVRHQTPYTRQVTRGHPLVVTGYSVVKVMSALVKSGETSRYLLRDKRAQDTR